MNEEQRRLVDAACRQRERSYSPYSRFRVGAALLGRSGTVYLGTNVENASFGLSICAERAAICRAIADGERAFTAIAVCADGGQPTPPCGACRQVLLEFGPDLVVLMAGNRGADGPVLAATAGELVPLAFTDFSANLADERAGASGEEQGPK
ncbi:MAG: cytidine deaminase [bacterium]|nr:cytidine deaminase [bacterium]